MSFVLPSSDDATPLLCTDQSRPDRWQALLACIRTPNSYGFLPYVTVVSDPEVDGATEAEIRGLAREDDAEPFVLVADAQAQTDDDFPILVVDISGENLPSFRVACRCLWAVQNNLSLANMDWEDFAGSTDPDGVYRTC